MYIRDSVCKRLRNYATCDLSLYFLAQFNYFYHLCRTKNNNNPKHIRPFNLNVINIKHLQGGATDFCFPVNVMCDTLRLLITVSVTPVCKSEIL